MINHGLKLPAPGLVALTVLSLITNRPLPDQGRAIRNLYLVFDLVLLIFTTLVIISIARMQRRYRHWKEQGITNWSIISTVADFTLPLVVLYLNSRVFFWRIIEMLQPDFYYWLTAIAVVLFVKGTIKIALLSSAFRRRPS
jgi:hypothetical protein